MRHDPAPHPRHRPLGRTLLGVALLVFAGVVLLGQIGRIATRPGIAAGQGIDPGFVIGTVVALLMAVGVPLLVGILLLRHPHRH